MNLTFFNTVFLIWTFCLFGLGFAGDEQEESDQWGSRGGFDREHDVQEDEGDPQYRAPPQVIPTIVNQRSMYESDDNPPPPGSFVRPRNTYVPQLVQNGGVHSLPRILHQPSGSRDNQRLATTQNNPSVSWRSGSWVPPTNTFVPQLPQNGGILSDTRRILQQRGSVNNQLRTARNNPGVGWGSTNDGSENAPIWGRPPVNPYSPNTRTVPKVNNDPGSEETDRIQNTALSDADNGDNGSDDDTVPLGSFGLSANMYGPPAKNPYAGNTRTVKRVKNDPNSEETDKNYAGGDVENADNERDNRNSQDVRGGESVRYRMDDNDGYDDVNLTPPVGDQNPRTPVLNREPHNGFTWPYVGNANLPPLPLQNTNTESEEAGHVRGGSATGTGRRNNGNDKYSQAVINPEQESQEDDAIQQLTGVGLRGSDSEPNNGGESREIVKDQGKDEEGVNMYAAQNIPYGHSDDGSDVENGNADNDENTDKAEVVGGSKNIATSGKTVFSSEDNREYENNNGGNSHENSSGNTYNGKTGETGEVGGKSQQVYESDQGLPDGTLRHDYNRTGEDQGTTGADSSEYPDYENSEVERSNMGQGDAKGDTRTSSEEMEDAGARNGASAGKDSTQETGEATLGNGRFDGNTGSQDHDNRESQGDKGVEESRENPGETSEEYDRTRNKMYGETGVSRGGNGNDSGGNTGDGIIYNDDVDHEYEVTDDPSDDADDGQDGNFDDLGGSVEKDPSDQTGLSTGGSSKQGEISPVDTSQGKSKVKESLSEIPISGDEETQLSKDKDDSYEEYFPSGGQGKHDDNSEEADKRGGDSADNHSDERDGRWGSDEDGKGAIASGGQCSVNDVGRCLGRLANFHSMTLPTHLFSSVDELCREVQVMDRCFRNMKDNCPSDVMYRVDVLKKSTNYICQEKREDFGEVYECLLGITDRYSRCYETYGATDTSVNQRKCRPVQNFEECVAQVTSSECGFKAGELVRDYYKQTKLNPLIDTDPEVACPVIEPLKEAVSPSREKTVLAVGLTLAGCVSLAAGVVISAIVGAWKRTRMAHYILEEA